MYVTPAWEPADRLRGLRRELAGDVDRIVEDLEFRREFLREIWSVSRDRGAFLDTVTTRWRDLGADDLLEFPTEDVAAVDRFYRTLDDFSLYLRFTDDMPATLLGRYDRALDRLKELGQEVIERLGGAPVRGPVDDATVHDHVRSFFKPARREAPAGRSFEENLEWTADAAAELSKLYAEE